MLLLLLGDNALYRHRKQQQQQAVIIRLIRTQAGRRPLPYRCDIRLSHFQSTLEQQQQHYAGCRSKRDHFGNILPHFHHEQSPLHHASNSLVNSLHTMRSMVQSCPEPWAVLCLVRIRATRPSAQMNGKVQKSASVFTFLGVTMGVNVAILRRKKSHWLPQFQWTCRTE